MTPFEEMQKYYRQRDLAAREWKKKGGRVVGYFCTKVPEEMISAAGFFPLRISGDPWGGTEAADKYTEPFYEGYVRSMLNMLLTGRYDFLDFLIIPHSRDTIVSLYGILLEIRELNPDLKLPEFYLFETLHTKFYLTELYNRERTRDLKTKLEEWSGKAISDASLRRAIAIGNENKMLLKKVAALRAAEPPDISGTEALQIIGASMFMSKEEHNKLLARFVQGAGGLPDKDGVRLFVTGSPLDNLQFYEVVESCQATIVAEDNCWGNRYSENLISTSLDPMEAIEDSYQHGAPCTWTYPMSARMDYCLQKATEAKAQGVVFYISEFDYAQTWDFPGQRKALEKRGIPTICFKDQKYLLSESDSKQLRASLQEFVKSIKSKAR